MSLKAIKEGLRIIVHDDMDNNKCTKCRMQAEIAALEKAARDITAMRPKTRVVTWVEGGKEYHAAADVLEAIAKEAE